MTANLLVRNVGSWSITLPKEHPLAPALRAPGAGVLVTGPGEILFSGPSIAPTLDRSATDPNGTVTVAGVTDDIILADALCWPDPLNASVATQRYAQDTLIGYAEDIIGQYVSRNIGPAAPASRRGRLANLLTIAASGHSGGTITKSARFDQLGPFIASIAEAAGLAFRVVQRGNGLVFETWAVRDRSKLVRLDIWNGQVQSDKIAVTAPTVTQVIVGGQGDLTDRTFLARTNPVATAAESDWGRRIEQFLDNRGSSDPAEYEQNAAEALAAGITGVAVQIMPMDNGTMRYGLDYALGDLITVVTDEGEISNDVTGANLVADSNGLAVGIVLGDEAALDGNAALIGKATATAERVASLEHSAPTPTVTGTVQVFAGTTIPPGWLRCNGASYVRTTYPALYDVIGTSYGAVDDTHFNVPSIAAPPGLTYIIKI